MKRYLIAGLAASLLLLPLGNVVRAEPEVPDPLRKRPNILIIMTDDQRAEGTMEVMPETLRIMAEGGTTYPNGVVTTPLCCPSRASIFSGQYVHNHGVANNKEGYKLNQDHTIQAQLHAAGYKTAIAGKFLNGLNKRDPQHFDQWALGSGYRNKEWYMTGGDLQTVSTYSTVFVKRKAAEFLDYFEQSDDAPWFMQVSPFAPHAPATPQRKYRDAPVPAWAPTPAQEETDLSDKYSWVEQSRDAYGYTLRRAKRLRRAQLRSLMSVDDLVEHTFARLEALGEADNTLIFFLSDNGWTWFDHQLNGKRYPYDEAVRVPFYVRWPAGQGSTDSGQVDAGVVDHRIAANIDIAPTIYEAAGVTPDYVVDGKSLRTSEPRANILMEDVYDPIERPYVPQWSSVWTPDSTYIRYYETDGRPREFYESDDPWQLENVYKDGIPMNEPEDEAERDALLKAYGTCAGATCP